MSANHRRSKFMTILEFDDQPAHPIPADSLDEAEYFAKCAVLDLARLARVVIYRWGGPGEEYVLVKHVNLPQVPPPPPFRFRFVAEGGSAS
jgi:hypothetical protein